MFIPLGKMINKLQILSLVFFPIFRPTGLLLGKRIVIMEVFLEEGHAGGRNIGKKTSDSLFIFFYAASSSLFLFCLC